MATTNSPRQHMLAKVYYRDSEDAGAPAAAGDDCRDADLDLCFCVQHGQNCPDPELRLLIVNNDSPGLQAILSYGDNSFLPAHIGFRGNPENIQMAVCPRSCNPA